MRVRPAIAAMIAVLIGCGVLGVVGLGVEDKLDPLSLTIDGTGSAKGEELAKEHFGDATQFAVLLTGPQAEIERQGPPLVRALRHTPKATVISPWDRGTVAALRPGQDKALIIVDYHVPLATAMRDTVPALDKLVEEEIHPPLTRHPVGLRLGLARAAGRNDRRHRAGRAARRAAPPHRPPDRLPLAGRRRDPARSSAPSPCSPAAACSSCSAR